MKIHFNLNCFSSIDKISFLSLVDSKHLLLLWLLLSSLFFRSLTMMYLGEDFLSLSCLEFVQFFESVHFGLLPPWKVFSHYIFEYFLSLTFFLLLIWGSDDMSFRTFVILPQVHLVLHVFYFFATTFYLFRFFKHVYNCSFIYFYVGYFKIFVT